MPAADRYAKAAGLLTGGSVRVIYASARGVRAIVTGSRGKYTTDAYYDARGRLVRSCTCDWSTVYHVGRSDCSHALAVEALLGESIESMRRK